MNDRSTILKIIRHPLIKEIMENKMATTSIVTKLIAEELQHENFLEQQQQQNSINKLLEVIEKYQEVFDLINPELNDSIKGNAEKVLELAGLFSQVNENKTQVHDKRAKTYFGKKQWDKAAQEILLGIDKTLKNIQSSIGQVQKQPNKAESLYNQLKTFVKFYQYGVSLKQFAKEGYDPEEGCIELLNSLIDAITLETKRGKKQFAEDSSNFIKFIPLKKTDAGHDKLQKIVIPAFKAYLNSIKKRKGAMDKFAELASNEEKCNKQFIELKSKDPEAFVIGQFFIQLDKIIEKLNPKKAPEDKVDINKMVDAMKRTNKLATEQKDIYWSVDGGFTQVFEVAYLPPGSETANNGTQEKPLTDYNISQENLKTGKKGSILIVRSEQLYKVEKIVQEQEEGKRITVSLPIDSVKQYNALFSGTEDEKGMPTGPGAFFVHSDQEKMVPLKAKKEPPSESPDEAPDPIDPDVVKAFIKHYKIFKDQFLKVKTLKVQSDIFYNFHQVILKLTGKPADEIVGNQLAALTRKAQNLQEDEEEKPTFKKSAVKGESKDILTGAAVTQKHVKSLQQIMKQYEQYLGKPGSKEGVTKGSRELFNRFGEADPKKVLYKFVKLLVNDINSMNSKIDKMLDAIEKSKQQKPEEEKEKQEINEEKKKLSLEEKVSMVEEVHDFVTTKIGENLLKAVSQFKEESEADEEKPTDKPKEEPAEKEGTEGDATATPKRDDLQEQEDQIAGGDVVQGDKRDQSAQKGDEVVGARSGRKDSEVYGNYKQLALEVDEQLERIASFFPTARPFDSKYTMQQATKSFLEVISRLDGTVANIKSFLRDEDMNPGSLKDLKQELTAIKDVMKSIFGFTEEQQEAENTAAINDEGADSGLPEPKDDTPPPEDPDKDPEEIPEEDKEILTKVYNDDAEYYEKIVKRQRELSAGESALDTGFVPEEPLKEVLENTEKLVKELESKKTTIRFLEKRYDKQQRKGSTGEIAKAKKLLQRAIAGYISIYEEIGEAIKYRDFSSVLDDPGTRVKRINLLMKETKKFLEQHKTTKEFFLGLSTTETKNAKDPAYLEGVFKRMKKLDGRQAAIVDSDMKYKIRRAKLNVEKTFQNKFPKGNYNFSSFKTFIGKVADQISGIAIRIGNALKEDEDPSSPEVKQKEFELYNKRVIEVVDLMKKFLTLYTALELAMDHLENKDVGRTRFLEAFDKEFSTITNFIKNSTMYLKKISTKFRNGEPNIAVAKIYGFPPQKTTTEPEEPAQDDGDTEDTEDKPIVIDKDNVKLKLPPPPPEVVKKARQKKKVQDLLDMIQDTIEDSVGTRKVDVKKNVKKVTLDLVDEYSLEDKEKEKLVKYFLDTTGKVKDEELPSEEELNKVLKKQKSGEELRYFESNYKPGKNDIKFEASSRIGVFMSAVIKFFKEDLNLQENIANVKNNIKKPRDLRGNLDVAIDKAEKLLGKKSFTEFSNFLSQTSTEKIPGGTPSRTTRKQNNAAEVFANLLKRTAKIDMKKKKADGKEYVGGPELKVQDDDGPPDLEKLYGSVEERIAKKIKSLIKEMLNKGK